MIKANKILSRHRGCRVVRRNRNIIIIILEQKNNNYAQQNFNHGIVGVVRRDRNIIIIILKQKKIIMTANKILSQHRRCLATQQKYNNYYFGTEKNNNYGHQNFYHGIVDVVSCDAAQQKYNNNYFETEKIIIKANKILITASWMS